MFTLIAFSKSLYIDMYIYIHTNYMKMHYYCKKAIARKKLVLLAITAKILSYTKPVSHTQICNMAT